MPEGCGSQDPRRAFGPPLIVLPGTGDTRGGEEDSNLRASSGAITHRSDWLQRGMTDYEVGQQAAHSASKYPTNLLTILRLQCVRTFLVY